MKKFYLNAIAFLIILIVVVLGLDVLSMKDHYKVAFAKWTNSNDYFGGAPDEIKPYIARAKAQDGTTKLIIGDSVCHQMFSGLQGYNPDFTIIGINGAITMAGQYILAKEYLDSHPDATDIFLIVLPESLGRTFDTRWGYQYTVMPFAETETLHNLDDNTLHIMANTYGGVFLNKDVVNALYSSAVNRKLYLNILKDHTPGYQLSNHFELSDQYVVKIAELCKSRGVNFYLYPCPVSETMKERLENYQDAFVNSKTYNVNPKYFDMVMIYPAEQSDDNVHFSGDYANQTAYNEKIHSIFAGEPLLEYLKFE